MGSNYPLSLAWGMRVTHESNTVNKYFHISSVPSLSLYLNMPEKPPQNNQANLNIRLNSKEKTFFSLFFLFSFFNLVMSDREEVFLKALVVRAIIPSAEN